MAREISVSAAIALTQASVHATEPAKPARGCVLAENLHAGDTFLRWGHSIGELPGGMVMELHPVSVVRDAEPDTTSDPFGRALIKFWVRDDRSGREGFMSFGPGGVVRVVPAPPYFVLAEVAA